MLGIQHTTNLTQRGRHWNFGDLWSRSKARSFLFIHSFIHSFPNLTYNLKFTIAFQSSHSLNPISTHRPSYHLKRSKKCPAKINPRLPIPPLAQAHRRARAPKCQRAHRAAAAKVTAQETTSYATTRTAGWAGTTGNVSKLRMSPLGHGCAPAAAPTPPFISSSW